MELIDAFWEKKNINKSTLEINFKHGDNFDDLFRVLDSHKYDYIVAKVPIVEPSLLKNLQDIGFRFCETQLSLFKNLKKNLNIDNTILKMGEKLQLTYVSSKNELQDIIDNLRDDMFSTDRIALDHNFGIEISNRRYKNWIYDEFHNNNTEIIRINKKDAALGFFMAKLKGDETVQVLLGGVYSQYQGMGLGYSIVLKPIERYLSMGKTIIRTKVSSNNLEVLKLYISMGYQIENMEYILVRHKEEYNHGE
ncbi:GNAT family N-acetyltransferase [Paenibacillus mesophilus]|uniref:GNAT family N-acetyltransferase n=1 Tax=Paenibacillus mesophilus TaxID=2582849 RepID=UPI00110DC9DC|nr:GNAT family N-acetyltransferase [Paenibacillus mesophilus]TMV50784.1 GNAT family N-acetyltransferase [Paenibacillus mesophilus]